MQSDDKYTLKPQLAEKFEGIIWKIEIGHEELLVAVESRDVENHKATFSLFEFDSGRNLFKNVLIAESWKWTLSAVYRGLTLLHSYLSDDQPQHQGLIALNKEGKIQWEHFNKTIFGLSEEGIIVYDPKIQPRRFEMIEPESGRTLIPLVKNFDPVHRDIILPTVIEKSELLETLLPEAPIGDIVFLRHNNKECFSFHIRSGENYTQQLIIIEGDNIILQDNLAVDIPKLNPEAFFISQDYLFCIRDEKREIVSYLL